jgi:hypothetical protein
VRLCNPPGARFEPVGLISDATGSTDGGLLALAAVLIGGSLLALRVAHDPSVERPPRAARFTRGGEPAVSPARRTASASR